MTGLGTEVSRGLCIRDIRTHIGCCSCRVGGSGRDSGPVGLAHQLRGDMTCIRERFASGKYEGSLHKQKRDIPWASNAQALASSCGNGSVSQHHRSICFLLTGYGGFNVVVNVPAEVQGIGTDRC
jgi:hypothetical protein